MSTHLLGRDAELARLSTLLDRVRAGNSGALVLSGPAGIGKTELLDRMVDLAGSGVRVERMVAWESEVELPYAGLQLRADACWRRREISPRLSGRHWSQCSGCAR
jgi:hypothetical protein